MILSGAEPSSTLVAVLSGTVLSVLPPPEEITPEQARGALVGLGFAGAAVGRYYQERDPAYRAKPERAFDPLRVGPRRIPFLDYVARLAARTGAGHPARDSFVSLVRWNAPATEARWAGQRLVSVPSEFADGRTCTYTGDEGERRFFELAKLSETLEIAVNEQLQPLSDDASDLTSTQALLRVETACGLLAALRQINLDFVAAREGGALSPDHFMDVLRQFAVHWRVGDLPPSGALDAEALKRDLLLGTGGADYERHLSGVFPALLEVDRTAVSRLALRPLRLDRDALEAMPAAALADLGRRCPALYAWYGLLDASARASAVHLMLAKRYLFNFNRVRERTLAGARPDPDPVVPNDSGTTGMTEARLQELSGSRRDHCLRRLRQMRPAAGAPARPAALVPDELRAAVGFAPRTG
jgi:hypothetical protein